jgi:hypothetical protein
MAAALGPIETGLLSHWTSYSSLTMFREMGAWEKEKFRQPNPKGKKQLVTPRVGWKIILK